MALQSFFSLTRFLISTHQVLRTLLRWVGVLFGLIPKAGRFSPAVYVVIHYVVILAITGALAWYGPRLVPESSVPISNWFVQRFYVAIQFVLLYLFIRLLIAAIQLFLARDVSEFEDIDAAWEAGLDALAREGFDIQWLPLFLISGATQQQQKSLFESARLTWKVSGASDDPRTSALSFHACDEALFICLNDVGAMSRQIRQTASARAGSPARSGASAGAQATLRPGQIQSAVGEQTRRPDQIQRAVASAAGATLAPGAIAGATMPPPGAGRFGETMRPGDIAAAGMSAPAASAPAHMVPEKLSQEDLRLNRRRLRYFCERLVLERGQYCPLNGILQVVPLRWTQSPAFEPLFGAAAQDLETLHDTLHLQFPVVCLHSGLEDVTGLAHFIERGRELDPRFKDSRAGSRYPAGLPIDEKSSQWVVERGMQWFRDWVYAEFARNLASPQNRQLYQFLCALSARRDRVAKELRTSVGGLKLRLPVRLTGWYFVATGSDAGHQGFVHGVMQRLMSEQNDVAWLPEWRSRDRRRLALTFVLSLLTLAVLAADTWLAWRIWERASAIATG